MQNEKEQLAAIDNKYSKQIEQMGQEELIRRTEVERRGRRTQLQSDEATHSAQDEEQAEELLKQIESA